MLIDFDGGACSDLHLAGRREWLMTNGIGGFASGTVAGVLTRRYHGLLVAALHPPTARTLLATRFDETARYHGRAYALFANRWRDGIVDPQGYHHLVHFCLEGATPAWCYALADALLEKRLWMAQGSNTTYVQYRVLRASAPLCLDIKALVNYRDYHGETHAGDWRMDIQPVHDGLRILAFDGATPFYLRSDPGAWTAQHEWYGGFVLAAEQERGFDGVEDHLYAGRVEVELHVGQSLTVAISTDPDRSLDGDQAYAVRRQREERLVAQAATVLSQEGEPPPPSVQQLVLAADQFIVDRASPEEPEGKTIIAGYPWFTDWGRDTMIALPGLTLATGRFDVARRILRTFARHVDQGMIPNRFPDGGEAPEYNTVDATLWYFEAIRAYTEASGDEDLLRELFPLLAEIVDWHRRSTRYNIHVDAADGLLYAGGPGVQLTWMDARVGDWVVTPRMGKPVEVNALWYNALRIMAAFAEGVGGDPARYREMAAQARGGFARFWSDAHGYCFDVIDGPQGDDPALRPNQIFAVSLPHSPLSAQRQRGVVDVCARRLLTPYGLRSLSDDDPNYVDRYAGGPTQRDASYHQGAAWGWLMGPFVQAHLRVYRDRNRARSFLESLLLHLRGHGVGSISEIFDGDPPFTPRGTIAQAWSVAEVLRAWQVAGGRSTTSREQLACRGEHPC